MDIGVPQDSKAARKRLKLSKNPWNPNQQPLFLMGIFIKIMIVISIIWVAVNAIIKFFPQYATELPLSVYLFIYVLTAQPWMILCSLES